MNAESLTGYVSQRELEKELVACPAPPSAPNAEPVFMSRTRCLERLKFASNTRNEFKNGCFKCQTGMDRFTQKLMEEK